MEGAKSKKGGGGGGGGGGACRRKKNKKSDIIENTLSNFSERGGKERGKLNNDLPKDIHGVLMLRTFES